MCGIFGETFCLYRLLFWRGKGAEK